MRLLFSTPAFDSHIAYVMIVIIELFNGISYHHINSLSRGLLSSEVGPGHWGMNISRTHNNLSVLGTFSPTIASPSCGVISHIWEARSSGNYRGAYLHPGAELCWSFVGALEMGLSLTGYGEFHKERKGLVRGLWTRRE